MADTKLCLDYRKKKKKHTRRKYTKNYLLFFKPPVKNSFLCGVIVFGIVACFAASTERKRAQLLLSVV